MYRACFPVAVTDENSAAGLKPSASVAFNSYCQQLIAGISGFRHFCSLCRWPQPGIHRGKQRPVNEYIFLFSLLGELPL
jgi:hypothetical protein